jgi:hypothetical protein
MQNRIFAPCLAAINRILISGAARERFSVQSSVLAVLLCCICQVRYRRWRNTVAGGEMAPGDDEPLRSKMEAGAGEED